MNDFHQTSHGSLTRKKIKLPKISQASSLFPLWVVLFGVEILGQTTGFHGFFVSHRRFPLAKISRTNVISILKRHGIIFVAVLLF